MSPPAISNAGNVIPKNLKIKLPAKANALSTTKHVQDARFAIRRRRDCSESAVIARNEGTAAKGSTRKKMELNATSENWKTELNDSCMSDSAFAPTSLHR